MVEVAVEWLTELVAEPYRRAIRRLGINEVERAPEWLGEFALGMQCLLRIQWPRATSTGLGR